jgi:polysaccharide biosynthesis transport protein
VPALLNEPDAERLKSARMGFLAQPLIAEAAQKANLLPNDDDTARSMALAKATQHIDARQEGADTFVVTYEDSDPARARLFLSTLMQNYTQLRTAEAATRSAQTAAFLSKEIDVLRPRVAAADAALEKVRLEHYGALPDQMEANLRQLDDNQLTVHALMASVDAAEGRRRDILADVQSPLRHQEEAVARDLSVARTRYAADAPEVKNLEAEMARVRADRVGEEGTQAKRIQSSLELRATQDQLNSLKGQIGAAQQRSAELRTRIEAAAKNGEAIAALVLDRDILRDRLKSLVSCHEDAALAAGLEAGVSGRARITLVEPAWVSATPVKPSKPLFAMGALALAIGLGLGVGFLLDGLDRRVLATEDVRALIGDLPLLGVVPRLDRMGRAANGNHSRAIVAAGSDT